MNELISFNENWIRYKRHHFQPLTYKSCAKTDVINLSKKNMSLCRGDLDNALATGEMFCLADATSPSNSANSTISIFFCKYHTLCFVLSRVDFRGCCCAVVALNKIVNKPSRALGESYFCKCVGK